MPKTIWTSGALSHIQKRFRPIFLFGLPALDIVLIGFGVFGLTIGSKIVSNATGDLYNLFWSSSIGLAALFALVALIFSWNWTEIAAKVWLILSLGIYEILTFAQLGPGSYTSMLTVCLTTIAIIFLALRIGDLVGVVAKKNGVTHE